MSFNYEKSFTIEGGNFTDAGVVSVFIKRTLQEMGVPNEVLRRVAIATYESEINIISYARAGVIRIRVTPENIILNVDDEGPGIENIELAMRVGYSTANEKIREMGFGAGMGIPNIINCSDDFTLTSEVSKGTHLRILINISTN
jgi:serine/threonine-protein kinase RsbT